MNPPVQFSDPPTPTPTTDTGPPRYYEELVRYESPEPPHVEHLVIDDDEPVDDLYCEIQMRLLTESLNSSWRPGRDFLIHPAFPWERQGWWIFGGIAVVSE